MLKEGEFTMQLDEAKKILLKAGFLVRSLNEDTETNDDDYDENDSEMEDIIFSPDADDKDRSKLKKLYKQNNRLYNKHMNLVDKIAAAKRFNKGKKSFTTEEVLSWIEEMTDVRGATISDNNVKIPPQFEGDYDVIIEVNDDNLVFKYGWDGTFKKAAVSPNNYNGLEHGWNRLNSLIS